MSLEGNKIFGAVLLAGVLSMTTAFVSDFLFADGHHHDVEYDVPPIPKSGGTEKAEEVIPDIAPLLATASIEKGEKVFGQCASCHSVTPDGGHMTGPKMWNIVNRNIGSAEGFKYSKVLSGMSDKQWTYEDLNQFLLKPKNYAKGTKMMFPGLKKEKQRADVILYLRSLADNPAELPVVDATSEPTPEEVAPQ